MEKGSRLLDQFKRELDKRTWTMMEWAGFKQEPQLALLAGMAIGYSLGLDVLKGVIQHGE